MASQKKTPPHFKKLDGSFPRSQEPPACPYPEKKFRTVARLCMSFRKLLRLCGELLAPRSTLKLKDNPLSAVHYIITYLLHRAEFLRS